MSPTSWTTSEQDIFLQEFFTQFVQCQAKRDYSGFWPPLYERWFAEYPERATVFPELAHDAPLSEEQKILLSKAIENRKEQLRNKLRNKWGAKKKARLAKDVDTKATTSLIADIMQSKDVRKRKPQKIEAYMNLYYEDRVWPAIKDAHDMAKAEVMAAVASDGSHTEKTVPKLALIMSKTREMFKKESPEVLQRVEERWNEMVAEGENKGVQKVKGKQFYIDRIAPILTQFLTSLQEVTGWSFTVLMGGPTPDAGGKVEACSFHVGVTELGHTFDQAHAEFNNCIMRPYGEFLEHVVPVAKVERDQEVNRSSPFSEDAMQTSNATRNSPELGSGAITSEGASMNNSIGQAPVASAAVATHPALSLQPSSPNSPSWPDLNNVTVLLPTPSNVSTESAGQAPTLVPNPVDMHSAPPFLQPASSGSWWLGPSDFTGLHSNLPVVGTTNTSNEFAYNFGDQTSIPGLENFLAKYGSEPVLQPLQRLSANDTTLLPNVDTVAVAVTPVAHPQPNGSVPADLVSDTDQNQLQLIPPEVETISQMVEKSSVVPQTETLAAVMNSSTTEAPNTASMVPQVTHTQLNISAPSDIIPNSGHLQLAAALQDQPDVPVSTQAALPVAHDQLKDPENTSTVTESSRKRARQPSKRNQIANSIGTESCTSKKQLAVSSGTKLAAAKKRKTK